MYVCLSRGSDAGEEGDEIVQQEGTAATAHHTQRVSPLIKVLNPWREKGENGRRGEERRREGERRGKWNERVGVVMTRIDFLYLKRTNRALIS